MGVFFIASFKLSFLSYSQALVFMRAGWIFKAAYLPEKGESYF